MALLNYNNGVKDGICKYYYDDGTLKSKTEFIKGKRHGIVITKYKSGIIKMKTEYFFGNTKYQEHYDEDGKLRKKFILENGRIADIINY